jgi:signal transduction histidine kinase
MIKTPKKQELDTLKPFRLVKIFSFTGLGLVLIFTMVLAWIISNYAKNVMLERSEAYTLLLAENLNRQVFIQFVLPTALRYGEIALRNPNQFKRLDSVVRNTTEGLKVNSVTIFDSEENIISYSTVPDLVGKRNVGGKEYQRALNGVNNSLLVSTASFASLLPGAEPISCKLMTYIPFRRENPLSERTDDIMGVTEIVQDLSEDMEAILKLQFSIILISILIMGTLFVILRQIVNKADQVNEARAEERRRLEESLHHSERLASLGEMVASVSHEIKNPLGIVRSTAEILNKRLKKLAPGNEHLAEIIVSETGRLDEIVREFLDFAKPQLPELTSTSLNDLLLKVTEFMQPEFVRRNIQIEKQLNGSIPPMDLDPNMLYRAFLNLLINAIQAMPDGGTITLTSNPTPETKNGAIITISDTGKGIPQEKQDMIFAPFYTEKNRGTGLGLAIAQNIIEGHNGSITVESEEGEGATFFISLHGE